AASFSKTGLKKDDLLFAFQNQKLATKIKPAFKNKTRLANFSADLAKKRDFSILATSYVKAIESVRPKVGLVSIRQALSGNV
ncbi:MAG: hypothetical protein AAB965_00680, partial [Patescibacteria group bacterium]